MFYPQRQNQPDLVKQKKISKLRTSIGQEDCQVRRVADNIRNNIFIDSKMEKKGYYKNQWKKCWENQELESSKRDKSHKITNFLSNITKNKQNMKNYQHNLQPKSFKAEYENKFYPLSFLYDRNKIDRFVCYQEQHSVRGSEFQPGNLSLRFSKNLIEQKNITERGYHRLVNFPLKRMEKTKSYNYKNYKSKTKKEKEGLKENQKIISYEFSTIKGSKQINQDTIKAGNGVWIVCDGHGQNGHQVSWYVANALYQLFQEKKSKDQLSSTYFFQAFASVQKNLEESGIDINLSGSTCVMIAIIQKKVYCACLGDSVAIAIYENRLIQVVSSDHKPSNPQQAKRIQFFGGKIKKTMGKEHLSGSPLRMWGQGAQQWGPGLAISRSFGDKMAQKFGLICVPEVKEFDICEQLKYIVLGSDGLFDQVKPTQMKNILTIQNKESRTEGCKILTEVAKSRWVGYSDDISGIVIYL